MTELREFARRSSEFEKLGVRVVGISVDDRQHAREAWEKTGAKKFTILSDPGAKVIRQYGLLHEKGHGESTIALRTTLLIDPQGGERWRRVSQSVPDIPTADETFTKIKETQQASPAASQLRMPNVETQREAMSRLAFLAGRWSGEAHIFPSTGQELSVEWTEDAQYKLGGLLLMIEGVGRNKSDDKVIRQALGFVSYDDLARTYRMHAYNDGRYLESELKLVEKGEGFTWGFSLGEIRTSSALRINENGAWTETHDITIGSQPSRRFMELTVIPKK